MSTVDLNCSVLTTLVVLFDVPAFEAKFIALELSMTNFLEWFATVAVPVANEIMENMEVSVSRRSSALRMSQFLKRET